MAISNSKVLVTGANGFIGKNLIVRLNELSNVDVIPFVRGDNPSVLPQLVSQVDAIFHLAGENRPIIDSAFYDTNFQLTSLICKSIESFFLATGKHVPLILASSIQAEHDNAYGESKLFAENAVKLLANKTSNPCMIFRLPGVFGKWCKPNYNSVVATFCHNIARNLPVHINNPSSIVRLAYVDDVVSSFLSVIEDPSPGCIHVHVKPEYQITLSELARQISSFGECRTNLTVERVGKGFIRALYATYVSYLPVSNFTYNLKKHNDSRGFFVEFLKTFDSGQLSYFTAHSGVTRGGHYHHTKSEKFLVLKGDALFRFRNLSTNEKVELRTSGDTPQVVDTIPGWTHDITNVGLDDLIVMLWANEVFNSESPDTVTSQL